MEVGLMDLKFSKVRDVKSPSRAHHGDAGIDFYIPNDYRQHGDSLGEVICILPQNRINIPSGIKVSIPHGYCLIAFNKSGLATKFGLSILACVVDSGYEGEIHLSVVNTGNEPVFINAGDKLVQFIYIPVILGKPQEVPEAELYPSKSERGEGGFGSTGS